MKVSKFYFLVWLLIVLDSAGILAQTEPSKKTYPFYATAGINQLITTEFSIIEVPTLSGLHATLGVGPIWRLTFEGQFSAHRLLGVNEAVENGFLLSYSWRAGIIPHKPVPVHFYVGAGYHVYHITYKPVEVMGYPFLPSVRTRRPTDYFTFGATYPVYRCLEVDLSYRREPFVRNNLDINANYISIGFNAWIYKYDRFPHSKKTRNK
jgi:hypothetical protein